MQRNLQDNLDAIQDRIQTARQRGPGIAAGPLANDAVQLVVVTKSVSLDVVNALIDLGCRDFGENRVQSLIERARAVPTPNPDGSSNLPPRWHMIGALQRNKVKSLLPWVTLIHSADRLRLAEELNKRAADQPNPVDILLEVNGADEPQKSGAAVCATPHLAEQIAELPSVRLRGLMSMAPLHASDDQCRRVFSRVAELYAEMRISGLHGPAFDTLSMGMSNDFQVAVECGANLVRIGSAVFQGIPEAAILQQTANLQQQAQPPAAI